MGRRWYRGVRDGGISGVFALAMLAASATTAFAAAPGSLCNTPSLCPGATSLPSTVNDQHYDTHPGDSLIGKIIHASDLLGTEHCTSGPAGVDVFVKSTDFGNITLCGSLSSCPGANCTITFSWTVPNGPTICPCNTSIVAYKDTGNNSNNDIIDDGVINGGNNPAGYAFLDQNGNVITTCGCTATTTTSSSTTSTTSTSTSSSSSSTSSST